MASLGGLSEEDFVDGLELGWMKTSGLWTVINDYSKNGRHGKLIFTWMLMITVGYIPEYIVTIVGPFYIEQDMEALTVAILNPLSAIQMLVKFSLIWYHMDLVCELLTVFKKDFLKKLPLNKRDKAAEIMSKAARNATFLAKLVISTNGAVICIWNILPVLRSQYCREYMGMWILGTPVGHNKILGTWYPGPMDDTPLVQIIYCYEFVVNAIAGLVSSVVEALSAALIIMLCGRFAVLKYLIEEERNEPTGSLAEQMRTIEFLVHEHQELLRIGDRLSQALNFPITVILSAGLLILIIGIFNFFMGSGNGDLALMVKFVIYIMYCLVEVAIYCLEGNNLEVASTDITFAVYCSDWYKKSPLLRKRLILIMTRSHQPASLKAGRLYPVNQAVLTNILNMAYSTSMFLYRMNNEDEQ